MTASNNLHIFDWPKKITVANWYHFPFKLWYKKFESSVSECSFQKVLASTSIYNYVRKQTTKFGTFSSTLNIMVIGYRVQSLGIITFDITETVWSILWHLIYVSKEFIKIEMKNTAWLEFWNMIKYMYFKYKITVI